MLTTGGAKLLDFGVAKFRPGAGGADVTRVSPVVRTAGNETLESRETLDAQITDGGAILGTLRYMAPEQVRGDEVDARSDLFSFGAVLYEMLTGRQAFDEETATGVRNAILEREAIPVSSLQPGVPPELEAVVRRCLAKDRDERWQTAAEVLDELKRVSESSRLARSRTREAWRLAAGVLVTAIAGLAVWLFAGGSQRLSTPPAATQIRAVAVLPLEDLSGDPEQEYFADGITEQLIADLATINDFRVISRTSVMYYRNTPKPVPTIARELRVDAIIEGTIVRDGDRVRVTAKLIRGNSGEVLWAQNFERELRDVMVLQREMARTITREVGITLTPQQEARLATARPINPEVHEQVLLGRHHAARATEEGLRKSVQYFETAIKMDPRNALAHAGLAEAYTGLNGFYMDPLEAMPKARQAVDTALSLDESLAQAHAALGYIHLVYDWISTPRWRQPACRTPPS
jgi:TolB-like protein